MAASRLDRFEMSIAFLWIPVTLIAAVAQTARNATQRRLTETIGTVGATHVRFLYGFPFALLFLGIVRLSLGEALPSPNAAFFGFILVGALTQILATGLMLAAMRERAFSVVTAYTKTEPIQVAIFGVLVLGEPLSLLGSLAILIATAGVVFMSLKRSAEGTQLYPVALGIGAGAFFAFAAIGFRGAIISLPEGSFLIRATTTLAVGLGAQTVLLLVWLALLDRGALTASLKSWRPSLGAGFLGALASQFWFIGFALTTAANVRTLALVEVLMAQAVTHRLFSQATTRRELLGMVLILAGVGLLLWSQA